MISSQDVHLHVISGRTDPFKEKYHEGRELDRHEGRDEPGGDAEGFQEGCGGDDAGPFCNNDCRPWLLESLKRIKPVRHISTAVFLQCFCTTHTRKGAVKSTTDSLSAFILREVRTMSNFLPTSAATSPFHFPFWMSWMLLSNVTVQYQCKYDGIYDQPSQPLFVNRYLGVKISIKEAVKNII